MTTLRRHPTKEVFGVVDRSEDVEAIVHDVEACGVDREALDVIEESDRTPSIAREPGALGKVAERLSEEHEFLEMYEDEVAHGHALVGIPLAGAIDKTTAQHILQNHGAHGVTYYGRWVFEDLSS